MIDRSARARFGNRSQSNSVTTVRSAGSRGRTRITRLRLLVPSKGPAVAPVGRFLKSAAVVRWRHVRYVTNPFGLGGQLRASLARGLNLRHRAAGRRRALAIAYHGIGETNDPGPLDLNLGVERFDQQVRYLKEHYKLVRASELLPAARARRRGGRIPVAITFDDDLHSHLALAKPVLDRIGAPGTFFLCGSSLDRPLTFWWDRLERAVAARLTDEAECAISSPPGRAGSQPVRGGCGRSRPTSSSSTRRPRRPVRALEARLGPDPETAGLRHDDVRALSSGGRHEIGFHTHSHYNLTILDDAQLAAELTEGRAEVMAAAGQPVTSIAYPGGRWNHRVLAAAREAGFELGLTCDPIPTFPDSDPIHVGRLVPAWCTDLAAFAFTVARAVDGHYPPWPIPPERPGPVAAPRLRAFAPGELPATPAPAEEAKLALPS